MAADDGGVHFCDMEVISWFAAPRWRTWVVLAEGGDQHAQWHELYNCMGRSGKGPDLITAVIESAPLHCDPPFNLKRFTAPFSVPAAVSPAPRTFMPSA